jgi:hypothetical protein
MAKTLATKMVISKKRKKKFIECLAMNGNVLDSAMAVGYTSTTQLHALRRDDEEFAEAWEDAVQRFVYAMEAEADRRGMHGVYKDVWYKGEVVGQEMVYSDSLLMFRLKALKPDMYNHQNRGANMNINFGIAVLPMQAESEEEWEGRALTMHKNQEIITLEDKPTENVLENRNQQVQRGD